MPVFRGFNKDYIQYVQQSFYSLFLYTEPKCVDLRTVIDESLSLFFQFALQTQFFYTTWYKLTNNNYVQICIIDIF